MVVIFGRSAGLPQAREFDRWEMAGKYVLRKMCPRVFSRSHKTTRRFHVDRLAPENSEIRLAPKKSQFAFLGEHSFRVSLRTSTLGEKGLLVRGPSPVAVFSPGGSQRVRTTSPMICAFIHCWSLHVSRHRGRRRATTHLRQGKRYILVLLRVGGGTWIFN